MVIWGRNLKLYAVLAGFLLTSILLAACLPAARIEASDLEGASPYLFVFAGDGDGRDSDFLMMIDVDPRSKTRGRVVSTLPTGQKMSMPHHTEYVSPPKGEPIFMNAHAAELSMIVDVSDPEALSIQKTFGPPAPYRFPHDYTRTPTGTRLVGFLRSNGDNPDADDMTTPGGHGGIAEYTKDGELIRTASAEVPGRDRAVRPYAFALLPESDRLVVTSAPMMETSWADVVQVFRYSDLTLLHTFDLPVGRLKNGREVDGSQKAGFGPRVLDDGSVFFNSYGCAFYHLTGVGGDEPSLKVVHTLKTKQPPTPSKMRGACGIPFRIDNFWVQPVGHLNAVVVFDIADPTSPKEVYRLKLPKSFEPHWLAKDPGVDRLILGAEMSGGKGFYMLRFDAKTGNLTFDPDFRWADQSGLFPKERIGYISLAEEIWPHGETGAAWGHAALFLGAQ